MYMYCNIIRVHAHSNTEHVIVLVTQNASITVEEISYSAGFYNSTNNCRMRGGNYYRHHQCEVFQQGRQRII